MPDKKCHIRLDYDSQKYTEDLNDLTKPGNDLPVRLAKVFMDAGYSVDITTDRHPFEGPQDLSSVILATSYAGDILRIIVESREFTDFYCQCDRATTAISGAQALIRLGKQVASITRD